MIRTVASILQTHKRTSDLAGRLGGEEFAVLLPEATLDSAFAAGERLRRLIAEREVAVGRRRIAVSVSVGASIAEAGMGGLDELLKQADVALYDAKRSGRNRVCRFTGKNATAEPAALPPLQGALATDAAMAASNDRESTFK